MRGSMWSGVCILTGTLHAVIPHFWITTAIDRADSAKHVDLVYDIRNIVALNLENRLPL